MSILLIDIGNSRLKWAMASSNGDLDSDFIDHGSSMNDSPTQLAQFDPLSKNQSIEKIICSSVIGETQTLALKKHLKTICYIVIHNMKPVNLRQAHAFCAFIPGLTNLFLC